jgi:hypothetical protein
MPPAPLATAPPQPTTQGGKPATPAPSPHEPTPEQLLAELTEIELGTGVLSPNPDLVRFYGAVGVAATAAANQLRVKLPEKALAKLAVDMEAEQNAASPSVRLLLELDYTLPDGRRVTLWKGSKQILSVDLSAINRNNEKQYQALAAKKTDELFKELVDTVLQARARAKAK